MKSLKLTLLLAVILLSSTASFALPIDGNILFDGTNSIRVAWNSTPGKVYLFQTSTNASGPWVNVIPVPGTITAVSNQIYQSLSVNDSVRFYRVTKLDTDGPEVNQVTPLDGSIAVSQKATVKASLVDETGINTNTISFQLGTNAPVTLGDSRLGFAGGVLTYTPGTNEALGLLGSMVTVRLSAADTLGNVTTNFTWSFEIALPTVPVANILFLGGTNGLVLISTNGDYFTYSYPGAFPGLISGQQLVNTNFYTGYTRAVVDFTNYPASNTVVVLTRRTKLAELLELGSLSGEKFTELTGTQSMSGLRLSTMSLIAGIDFNHHYDLKQILFQDSNLTVEILTNSHLYLKGTLEISGNFQGKKLTKFESKLAGDIDFRVEAHVGAQGAIDQDGSITLIPQTNPPKRFAALIGGVVPVWIDLTFELNAGYSAHLEGSANYTNGVQATKEFMYGRHWDLTNGWSTISQNSALELTYLGPRWSVQGTGNLGLL